MVFSLPVVLYSYSSIWLTQVCIMLLCFAFLYVIALSEIEIVHLLIVVKINNGLDGKSDRHSENDHRNII